MALWKKFICLLALIGVASCGGGKGSDGDAGSGATNNTARAYTFASDVTAVSGVAVYRNNIYAATGALIRKIDLFDTSVQSTYYDLATVSAGLVVKSLRVSGNSLYVAAHDTQTANSDRIIHFDLTSGTPSPTTRTSGLNNLLSLAVSGSSIYFTEANKISVRSSSGTVTQLVSTTDMSGNFSAPGIDADDSRLYFASGTGVYSMNFDGTSLTRMTTLPDVADDLQVYNGYAYVSSKAAHAVYRVALTGTTYEVVHSLDSTESPSAMAALNDRFFIGSPDTGKVLALKINNEFSNALTITSPSPGNYTYTLNSDVTVNTSWEGLAFTTGTVVINGNNHTITINNQDTGAMFYGGGESSATRLEIKNLKVVATTNALAGVLHSFGHVKLTNTHLKLQGDIKANSGGLIYSLVGSTHNVEMDNCSAVVSGKIGANAGSLMGYFGSNSGSNRTISNSFAIVSDAGHASGAKTLGSGAGAFVGSGVSNDLSITNSYVIFNGSMAYGSGIIGGKFLGSSGDITLTKFYAFTNITSVTSASNPADNSQQAYFLTSAFGGSLFNNLTAQDVNILDLTGTNLDLYATTTGPRTSTYTGITVHTSYSAFAAAANTANARVGSQTFNVNYDQNGSTSPYLLYSPTTNITYGVTVGDTTNVQ